MQHAKLNPLSITKQIFLNIYNFPSALVSLKYQDAFRESTFESLLSCNFFVWAQNFCSIQWIANFNTIFYSHHLNIGQDW